MIYSRTIAVEFNHCDPAGIVFYPRYFEMINSVIENFFASALAYPFARITMAEHSGVPTVRIEAEFQAPSRLGDQLEFRLKVAQLGRSSVHFDLVAQEGEQVRLNAHLTLVWVTPDGKAGPWPAQIKAGLLRYLEGKS